MHEFDSLTTRKAPPNSAFCRRTLRGRQRLVIADDGVFGDYLRIKKATRWWLEAKGSVDRDLVFISGSLQIVNDTTGKKTRLPNVGMVLFLCDGRKMNIPRPMARDVMNDGVLARLGIKTTFG